jgi:4-amino-4-deoxy-L-arabinose transferase-like glycosyltransferase
VKDSDDEITRIMTGSPQQLTESVVDVKAASGKSLYRGDALICALLMAGCMLLAQPFLEMGFLDDWSYIKTAQVFARTGHFVYNGWATATLGWQILWGALFSRLFGFSFVHVRLSTLPVAMASVYLFHQILVRFGISRGNAVFGSLCLALSPPFLVMSATYMTDVPGVFCTFLCLYLCQRAIAATADRTALGWLCLAAVTNIVGGTVRQTAWLGVLVILPSAVWLLRRRSAVLWGGTLLWLVSAATVFGLIHWFNRQPYFLPPRIPAYYLTPAAIGRTVLREAVHAIQSLLCTLLLLLPVLVAWWPMARLAPKHRPFWLFWRRSFSLGARGIS